MRPAMDLDLDHPPYGCHFERQPDGCVITISTIRIRAWLISPLLLPIFLMMGCLGLFGPWTVCDMLAEAVLYIILGICGHLRVSIRGDTLEAFLGVGKRGRQKTCSWNEVTGVHERTIRLTKVDRVELELANGKFMGLDNGKLPRTRRRFLVGALRQMLVERQPRR